MKTSMNVYFEQDMLLTDWEMVGEGGMGTTYVFKYLEQNYRSVDLPTFKGNLSEKIGKQLNLRINSSVAM